MNRMVSAQNVLVFAEDEAEEVESRRDALTFSFNDLCERLEQKSSNMERSIPLALAFTGAHNRLCEFCTQADRVLCALSEADATGVRVQVAHTKRRAVRLLDAAEPLREQVLTQIAERGADLQGLLPAAVADAIELIIQSDYQCFDAYLNRLRERCAELGDTLSRISSRSELDAESVVSSSTDAEPLDPVALLDAVETDLCELEQFAAAAGTRLAELVVTPAIEHIEHTLVAARQLKCECEAAKARLRKTQRRLRKASNAESVSPTRLSKLDMQNQRVTFQLLNLSPPLEERLLALERARVLSQDFHGTRESLSASLEQCESALRWQSACASTEGSLPGSPVKLAGLDVTPTQTPTPTGSKPGAFSFSDDSVQQLRLARKQLEQLRPELKRFGPLAAELAQTLSLPEDAAQVRSAVEDLKTRFAQLVEKLGAQTLTIAGQPMSVQQMTAELEAIATCLAIIDEKLLQRESPSVLPDTVRERVVEVGQLDAQLDQTRSLLEQVAAASDALLNKQTPSELAADEVSEAQNAANTASRLLSECSQLKRRAVDKKGWLEDLYRTANSFWETARTLRQNVEELNEGLETIDAPHVESAVLVEQLEELENANEDAAATKKELDAWRQQGQQLVAAVAQSLEDPTQADDTPEAQQVLSIIADLVGKFATLNERLKLRRDKVQRQYTDALAFEHNSSAMDKWLTGAEEALATADSDSASDSRPRPQTPPSGVVEQLDRIKLIRDDLQQEQQHLEYLNQLAQKLVANSAPENAHLIVDSNGAINRRWSDLMQVTIVIKYFDEFEYHSIKCELIRYVLLLLHYSLQH